MSEDKTAWMIFWFVAILNILAIERIALEIVIYPIYVLILESIVLWFLLKKRRRMEKAEEAQTTVTNKK